jgi:hypothetical protein
MAYFNDDKLNRLELPSNKEYWVDIVVGFRWKDVKEFVSADGNGNVNFAATADKVLQRAIKDWNLDQADGEKAEINAENIDRLEQGDVLFILDKLNMQADNNTKKN